MATGLRLAIASQTPLARMKRSLADLEADYGALPDPVPLETLQRGVDYTVTPGGVARMVHAAIEQSAPRFGLHGEWVALWNGFPRDLSLGRFRLSFAKLTDEEKEGYALFKEAAWAALNGVPPEIPDPAAPGAEPLRRAFEAWSRANAERVLASHEEEPFDAFYVNDWQHLPQGRLLDGRPRVLHHHVPVAAWQPAPWRDWLLRGFRDFDRLIVSTDRYVRALRALGYDKPVHRVYPWLDPLDYPEPAPRLVAEFEDRYGLAPDDDVVLHVGRMDPIKAQDRLVRALPKLLRARPRAKLVLIGNGSFSSSKKGGMGLAKGARWREALERLARELGVADRVVFTGHVAHRHVVPAFHRADAFAFPSVAEGFGLAVAEAWLAKRPVVVSPDAGAAEVVREGENGLVADATDADAFAAAIERAIRARDSLGEAGRRTALEVCDVRKRAPEVVEILRAAAEGREPDLARFEEAPA